MLTKKSLEGRLPVVQTDDGHWLNEEEFDAAVQDALMRLPRRMQRHIDNVVVFVAEEYEPEPWEDAGTELLGLYEGIPLTERGDEPWAMPDQITIFRGPLERRCSTRGELVEQITVTVVHEVAHFFGIDDAELHRLGWG